MSRVTGVTLVTHTSERQEIYVKIDEWLKSRGPGWTLGDELSDGARTSKHPQTDLFTMGLNNFNVLPEFLGFMQTHQWDNPECVVLVIHEEEREVQVWRPKGYE